MCHRLLKGDLICELDKFGADDGEAPAWRRKMRMGRTIRKNRIMDIQAISNQFQVKVLSEEDIPDILCLCKGNPQYYKYCLPLVNERSIYQDIRALPPGKTANDKFYLGFFTGDMLVAVMDYIHKFLAPSSGFIGFFMTNVQIKGRGIGSQIIEEFCQMIAHEGIETLRLGWVKDNEQARQFWHKNYFTETGETSQKELNTIVIAERAIDYSMV